MIGPQDHAHPRFDRDLALGLGVPRAAARRLPGTPDAATAARDFARATVAHWRTPVTAQALDEAVEDLLHGFDPHGFEREEGWLSLVEAPDALLLVLTPAHSPPAEGAADALRATPDATSTGTAAEHWTRIPFPGSPRTHSAPPSCCGGRSGSRTSSTQEAVGRVNPVREPVAEALEEGCIKIGTEAW
ncbi:hypothetical protein [Kitasatospora sp. NPDC059803]|uniref:hypothetical protein n=1 Tax=Kitasatospora sp. NPDC059803 TaxID=3346953 RepID=UPI00365F30C5